MTRVPKLFAIALLAGCLSSPSPGSYDADPGVASDAAPDADPPDADPMCDEDRDGYLRDHGDCPSSLPADCRDDLPAVHPGAYDVPGNGVDEDCLAGDSIEDDAVQPMASSTGPNGINFYDRYMQGRLGAANGYSIDELGGAVFGGPNFLYNGSSSERLAGVHVWETYFSYDTQTVPVPVYLAEGRAVLRVRVPWDANQNVTVGMTGTTIYTIWPDGRIHIDHDFEILDAAGSIFNTAYLAVDATAIDAVEWSLDDEPPVTVGDFVGPGLDNALGGSNGEREGYICGYEAAGRNLIGFGFNIPLGFDVGGPRFTEANYQTPTGHYLAFQYDFTRNGAVPLREVSGNFLIHIGWTLEPSPCAEVQNRMLPWLNPAVLQVSSPATLVLAGAGDDDGDGYAEGGGYYLLHAEGEQSITFAVDTSGGRASPPTSAYRFEGMDLTHDPIVIVDGTRLGHGDDYVFQTDGLVGWLFLRAPLAGGANVTVRAP